MPGWMTALLALTPLAGVWLGAALSQHGAERLAKQTLDGQRMLADDAALREWRRQQVAPFLEAANQRARLWMEILDTTLGPNEKTLYAVLGIPDTQALLSKAIGEEGLLSLTDEQEQLLMSLVNKHSLHLLSEQTLDSRFTSLLLTISMIPDETFRAAFMEIVNAEGNPDSPFTSANVGPIVQKMRPALAALSEAAERYIFAPPPSDKS